MQLLAKVRASIERAENNPEEAEVQVLSVGETLQAATVLVAEEVPNSEVVTRYEVTVETPGLIWTVFKRYNEFRSLRENELPIEVLKAYCSQRMTRVRHT